MFAAVTKFVAVRGTCIAIHSCGERSKAKQKVATGDGGGSEKSARSSLSASSAAHATLARSACVARARLVTSEVVEM